MVECPLTDHSDDVFELGGFEASCTDETQTPDCDSTDWKFCDAVLQVGVWNSERAVPSKTSRDESDSRDQEQAVAEVRPQSAASNYGSIISARTSIQTFETARSQTSIAGLRQSLASHLNELR